MPCERDSEKSVHTCDHFKLSAVTAQLVYILSKIYYFYHFSYLFVSLLCFQPFFLYLNGVHVYIVYSI